MDLMSMVMRAAPLDVSGQEGGGDLGELLGGLDLGPVPAVREDMQGGAFGISLSATIAPSSGLTRSSRPQVSSVCLRSLWASRQSMPSSAVSGFQKDMPIERIASCAPGAVASANRSSTSSSVTSSWLTTMVEMKARSASRRRVDAELHQPLHALGRVGVEEVERETARAHQDQPADAVGVGRCASRIAVPPPRLLPSRWIRSMPSSSSSCDDVVGGEAGSSCRPPAACRSRRSRAGRPAGCGTTHAKCGSARAEVGPRRRTGAAAVQHHQRQVAADPGRAPARPRSS